MAVLGAYKQSQTTTTQLGRQKHPCWQAGGQAAIGGGGNHTRGCRHNYCKTLATDVHEMRAQETLQYLKLRV